MPEMKNRRMAEKLSAGECLDVLTEGVHMGGGRYLLRRFVPGMDYCDAGNEWWIWSIGRNRLNQRNYCIGERGIYQDESWDCLFLR